MGVVDPVSLLLLVMDGLEPLLRVAVGVADTVLEDVKLGVALEVSEGVGDGVSVDEGVADELVEADWVRDGVEVVDRVTVELNERVADAVPVELALAPIDIVGVAEGVPDGVMLGVNDGVGDALTVALKDASAEEEGNAELVSEGAADTVEDLVTQSVAAPLTAAVDDCDWVAAAVTRLVVVRNGEAEPLSDTEPLLHTEADAPTVRDAAPLKEMLFEAVGERESEGLADGLRDGADEREPETLKEEPRDADGEAEVDAGLEELPDREVDAELEAAPVLLPEREGTAELEGLDDAPRDADARKDALGLGDAEAASEGAALPLSLARIVDDRDAEGLFDAAEDTDDEPVEEEERAGGADCVLLLDTRADDDDERLARGDPDPETEAHRVAEGVGDAAALFNGGGDGVMLPLPTELRVEPALTVADPDCRAEALNTSLAEPVGSAEAVCDGRGERDSDEDCEGEFEGRGERVVEAERDTDALAVLHTVSERSAEGVGEREVLRAAVLVLLREGAADADSLAVTLGDRDARGEEDADKDADGAAEVLGVSVAAADQEVAGEALCDPVAAAEVDASATDAEPFSVGVASAEGEGVAVGEMSTLTAADVDGDDGGDAVGEALLKGAVGVYTIEGDSARDAEAAELGNGTAVAKALAVAAMPDTEISTECVNDAATDADKPEEVDTDGVTETELLATADPDAALADAAIVARKESDTPPLPLGDCDAEGERDGERVADADFDGIVERLGEAEADADLDAAGERDGDADTSADLDSDGDRVGDKDVDADLDAALERSEDRVADEDRMGDADAPGDADNGAV